MCDFRVSDSAVNSLHTSIFFIAMYSIFIKGVFFDLGWTHQRSKQPSNGYPMWLSLYFGRVEWQRFIHRTIYLNICYFLRILLEKNMWVTCPNGFWPVFGESSFKEQFQLLGWVVWSALLGKVHGWNWRGADIWPWGWYHSRPVGVCWSAARLSWALLKGCMGELRVGTLMYLGSRTFMYTCIPVAFLKSGR